MSLYRAEFEDALRVLARASEAMKRKGFAAPVLVGGAAVELYSGSAIATGDFDVVTGRQDAFEDALLLQGFTKPVGVGHTPLGWVHPDLRLGFEVVAATLLDGLADRERARLFALAEDGEVAVIALEDIIADRMGQYAFGSAPEMIGQARALFDLYPDADIIYLERRIREETAGEYGIDVLRQ